MTAGTAVAEGMRWRAAVLGVPGDGGVRCDLCPHLCVLGDGQTGACQVRRNEGGRLETATFAVSVSHVDAVERKPLYHVWPGRAVLTVAAPGCTFRCNYCVNHRLSQFGRVPTVGWDATEPDLDELVRRADSLGAAIGMSYSEPGLAPELALAIAERAAAVSVPLVWKTNGFLTARAIDLIAPVLTAVNVDLKAAADGPHRRLTGAPVRPVFDAIERFRAAGVWVEVSTPLIPGVSDGEAQLRSIAGFLAGVDPTVPWHLVRFTPDFRMGRYPPTAPAALHAARSIGREAGLAFVYVERALGAEGRRTWCPNCDRVLVERDIWRMSSVTLRDGDCPQCSVPVPGIWEVAP
jgi:pyruvate formate lyase activating enzyme